MVAFAFLFQVVPLDWWPLTRDCLAYGITVAILICIIHDERVEWYEALILVLLYIVYIAVMYYDKAFQKCARGELRLFINATASVVSYRGYCKNRGWLMLGLLIGFGGQLLINVLFITWLHRSKRQYICIFFMFAHRWIEARTHSQVARCIM